MKISEVLPNGNVRIVIPMALRRVKHRQVIVDPESEGAVIEKSPVLVAIANGFLWQKMLDEKRVASIDELAKRVGKERAVVSHTLQLTLLSPEIIHMALTGTLPPSVNMKSLKAALPSEWENQKEFLGVG